MTNSARPIVTPRAPGGKTLKTGPSDEAAQSFRDTHAALASKPKVEAEHDHEDPQAARPRSTQGRRAGGAGRASPDSPTSDEELSLEESLAMLGPIHKAAGVEAFDMQRLPPPAAAPPPPDAPRLPEPAGLIGERPEAWVVPLPAEMFHPAPRVVPGTTEPGLALSAIEYRGHESDDLMSDLKSFFETCDNIPKEHFQQRNKQHNKLEQLPTFSDYLKAATENKTGKLSIEFSYIPGPADARWLPEENKIEIDKDKFNFDANKLLGSAILEILNAANGEAFKEIDIDRDNGSIARETKGITKHAGVDAKYIMNPIDQQEPKFSFAPGIDLYGRLKEQTEFYNARNYNSVIDALHSYTGAEIPPSLDMYRHHPTTVDENYEFQKGQNHTSGIWAQYDANFYSDPRVGTQGRAESDHLLEAIEQVMLNKPIGEAARMTEGVLNKRGRINGADLADLRKAEQERLLAEHNAMSES